jgi:hypothetical protein
MTHTISRTASSLLVLLVMALAAGCSVQPGEYRVYRAAFEPERHDADCHTDPATDADTSSFFAVDTFVVFASDDDTYFLEFAGRGLTGTRDGDDYQFHGDELDVEIFPPDPKVRVTTTLVLDVALELSGEEAFGEYTRVDKRTCTGGSDCAKLVGATTCTSHGTFYGTWVKGASIDYSLPEAGS